jgi:transmembrane sensor
MEDHRVSSLIIRYLNQEATPKEEKELLEWIAEDASHQRIFNNWQQVWHTTIVTQPAFDINRGLQRLNEAIDKSEQKRILNPWIRVAASVAVLATTAVIIYLVGLQSFRDRPAFAFKEQRTTVGQRTSIRFDDGSTIILNANSSLRYLEKFSRNEREVFLTGEAFFEVAKDPDRPFIVHSGQLRTEVLGTSFNINATSRDVAVSVASGRVRVIHEDISEIILAKEKIVYKAGERKLHKLTANLERELAWKENTILFEDDQLSEAALKLTTFYGVIVVFEQDDLKKCPITGKFKNQPLETVLDAIRFSTGIQYRTSGKRITFYGQGCE